MKKLFTSCFIALIVFSNVFADHINKEKAQQVAYNFYKAYAPAKQKESSILKTLTEKYNGTESFYIFGFEQGGFVIVSADDYAVPILGYSFISPASDKIGSNIRYLFDNYKLEIEDAKSIKSRDNQIQSEWDKLLNANIKGEIKAAGPLLTTTWNQSPYYNYYCPTGTPTGCVATAMSQIMNYHNWPISGNGWHKYIPYEYPEYGIQYADFEAEVYDWANMPVSLSSSSDAIEIEAVATLNYHAGIAVNMNYTVEGSGATSKDVMYALTSYFKYDPTTIEYVIYNSADETTFLNKIKTEIDNNRPVYYSGQSYDGGGHAWVCDGYDDANKVHINWGWGGSYNGYFLLSDMSPGSHEYTKSNSMIVGIQPGSADQDMLWTKKASGFENELRGIQYISVVDKRIAWATAYDGAGDAKVREFTRTIDGNNWVAGTINASGTNGLETAMISAVDENTAWVALFDGTNGGGKIVKTSDGGQNWIHQSTAGFTAPNGFPNVVHFWDENNGWCQGDPNGGYFEMYTTTDGGDTWTRVPQANIPANLDGEYGTIGYYDVYDNIVWFATNKGRIFKSTDKGYNWVVYQTPLDTRFETSFRNENVGIIQRRGTGSNKVQYITNNGGQSWTELVPTGNFYTNSFKYVPGTNVLISTGSDYTTPFKGVSYSTDDGATFNDYADFYQNYQFLALGAAGEDAIWAGEFNEDENNEGMWQYGNILVTGGFNADNTNYCTNTDVIFTDDTYGTPDSWTWDFGEGATPATATGKGPHTVTYSTSGYKDITLTVDKDADQHVVVKEEHIYISGSVPDDAGTITGETNVEGGEKHLYSVTDQTEVIFNWEIPAQWTGSSTTHEIEIQFTGTAGAGTITITPTNACGDGASGSLEVTVSSGVGIDDIDQESISVYPVPAREYISVKGVDEFDIYIYDNSGKLVKSVNKMSSDTPVDLRNLNPGIYYISVIVDNATYTKEISIIK